MIENDRMKVNSKLLITELKGFVAAGSSYKAKPGETDDLVSASLLTMRIITVLKAWDPRVYDTFNQADEEPDDFVPPMPIMVTTFPR